jgi:hypothetical protein
VEVRDGRKGTEQAQKAAAGRHTPERERERNGRFTRR